MRRFMLAASLVLTASAAAAQTLGIMVLQLDSDKSNVTATIGGTATRFGIVAGALQYNSAKPEESTINLSLDTTSLADQTARQTFDATAFPELRIESAAIAKKSSGGSESLPAVVTIRNINKPAVLQVTFKQTAPNVITMHAEGTLRSADFKMKGGNIQLVIDAPFNRVGGEQR